MICDAAGCDRQATTISTVSGAHTPERSWYACPAHAATVIVPGANAWTRPLPPGETAVGPELGLSPTLVDFIEREGYVDAFVRPDGQVAFLLWTAAGQGQIGLGGMTPEEGVSDRWTFLHPLGAAAAYRLWQVYGDAEPAGWIRHQPSNRRRTYGRTLDDYTEEVRP